ncbi:class I SAM-dependent methyltransferase [Candidatus Uhrbacteria bacterium]|nr:class I SAM-dependent methyltransferase [Candidatus Uhrbacteria bacterium]
MYAQNDLDQTYRVLDIGCSRGHDLLNIKKNTRATLEMHGIEITESYAKSAREEGIEVKQIDIEREVFDYADNFFDVIIANQVLEHTKELFWIYSEARRVLKPGGIFIVGVPNLASWHNRLLLLIGKQPAAIVLPGTHVRGFTIDGLKKFSEANGLFAVKEIDGSNFYPLPWSAAKRLSHLIPSLSVCIFLCLEKTDVQGSHIDLIADGAFETNYVK